MQSLLKVIANLINWCTPQISAGEVTLLRWLHQRAAGEITLPVAKASVPFLPLTAGQGIDSCLGALERRRMVRVIHVKRTPVLINLTSRGVRFVNATKHAAYAARHPGHA